MRKCIARHSDKITGVLSGCDRILFRGHLPPLYYESGVRGFLSRQNVLLKDFEKFAQNVTALVFDAAVDVAERRGRPVRPLENSRISKEDLARSILAESPVRTGPIYLLSIQELCSTWQVWRSYERLHPQQLRRRSSKCLHYYTYFLDPQFGLGHQGADLDAVPGAGLPEWPRVARPAARPRTHELPVSGQLLPAPCRPGASPADLRSHGASAVAADPRRYGPARRRLPRSSRRLARATTGRYTRASGLPTSCSATGENSPRATATWSAMR